MTSAPTPPRLDDVRGFMFDVDGTLVARARDGSAQPLRGAREVLERIRASGRPLVLFTNGSHIGAEAIAAGLSRDGVPVSAAEMLTPIESAISHLRRNHPGRPVLLLATRDTRERIAAAGIELTENGEAEVVLVAHVDEIDMSSLERAARVVAGGGAFFTSSYASAYAGASGPIFSRGAMVTAAIAKAARRRPRILGKPSRAAIIEVGTRLGVPTDSIAVIGDDLAMDIALGRLGGARTVLVRSGISHSVDLDRVPLARRPDAVIEGVEDLLAAL